MKVAKKRSLAKALTYRFICTTETFIVTWIITDQIWIASGVAFILMFSKLITFYLHERLWEKIKWGKYIKEGSEGKEI